MTRSSVWLFGSVVLGVLGSAAAARAQAPLADGPRLSAEGEHGWSSVIDGWLPSQTNERGQHCDQHEIRMEPGRILIACGAAGVWVVELTDGHPRFVASHDFGGEAVGFFGELVGDHPRTWVKLQMLEARPLPAASEPAAPPQPSRDASFPELERGPSIAPPAAPPKPAEAEPLEPKRAAHRASVGKVIKKLPGAVVISLGAEDNIERSQRIELALDAVDPDSEGETFVLRDTLAVGVVTNVTDHTAKVRLGMNEDVPLGARALVTTTPVTASLSAPPRVADIWQMSVMARPFAALSELGGGALLGFDLGRRTNHLHVSATLEPLAFAIVSDKPGAAAANGAITLAYDSQFFEMGLGLGAQTVNDPSRGFETGSGLTLQQVLRIGALDGTSFTARTNVALFRSELMFGGMVADARFHLTRGYWLQLGGGGGAVGYAYGEIGLRALLSGNGLAGSTYLTVTAGGAGVFKTGDCPPFEPCSDSISYGGPMAGIGGEWRF